MLALILKGITDAAAGVYGGWAADGCGLNTINRACIYLDRFDLRQKSNQSARDHCRIVRPKHLSFGVQTTSVSAMRQKLPFLERQAAWQAERIGTKRGKGMVAAGGRVHVSRRSIRT